MRYEDWTKFGAVRGLIGGLLAGMIILMTIQSAVDLISIFIGSAIAVVVVSGMYTLYAYALGDSLARKGIRGWKAIAVMAVLVGATSALIVLAIPSPATDMSSPGTAVAYSYQYASPYTNTMNVPVASVSVSQPVVKDVALVLITSVFGELMVAFFTAGIYRVFNVPLPEVE